MPAAGQLESSDELSTMVRAVSANSPDAIIVIDESATIVFANAAVETLFGYTTAEVTGAPLATLIPTSRRGAHAHHIAQFFAAPEPRQMGTGLNLFGLRSDQSEFAVDVSLVPVSSGDRLLVAAYVRDATARALDAARLKAVNQVTRELLAGTSEEEVLPTIATLARELLSALGAWIVVPNGRHALEIVAAAGPGTEKLLGVTISDRSSRAAQVMATGASIVVEGFSDADNIPVEVAALSLGPGLLVPLVDGDRRFGALVVGREVAAPSFSPVDVAFGELFGSAITATLELASTRKEVERLNVVAEEERIARDLHDKVIQQLFAVGMSLQSLRRSVAGPAGERLDAAVDNIDDVIREIRNTIFQLPGRAAATPSVRSGMLDVAEGFRDQLGFQPRVRFDGPVDVVVADPVVEHLVQVFGETLANVVRHARASRVDAVVSVEGPWLRLVVSDDGVGAGSEPSAGHGLANIAARAAALGGRSEMRRGSTGGTVLEWCVPVSGHADSSELSAP